MIKGSRKKSLHRPEADKLHQDPRFTQILELEFGEMIPFVLTNIKRRSFISVFYAGINIGLLIYILFYTVGGLLGDEITWPSVIKQSLAGIFAGSFLIIPVHELLHGLAYRILGARKIHFGADMNQLIFYVTADRYTVSGSELYFLAMLPFAIINFFTALLIILWLPQSMLFGSFLLLSHNIMCIGDFAIVNYVRQYNSRVFTFDLVKERKSYFFREVMQ
jgi:hypothetical protein